ncbi:MAG: hypothetical protein IJI40_09445 [Firmicutes bacterium]|nr:hypothetical protein [Bacillota bacterium]
MIVNQKPSYWITVRDNFWNFCKAESGAARMYEPEVYRSPVVKSIGLTETVAEGNIYASGIVYDYTRQVQGEEIALDAVALDHFLEDKAAGAVANGGFIYDKSTDVGKEFAFGYYLQQRDGNFVFYWHPRCLLTKKDSTVETSKDSAPDPSRPYTIRALPTVEGVWRVRYYTEDVQEPLTPEEFFAFARYTDKPQASSLSLSETVKVGTAVTATLAYADGASPSGATVEYSWWICETADGDYTQIDGATAASFTPDAADEGLYIKCVALVSDSAVGYVESAAAQVAAA